MFANLRAGEYRLKLATVPAFLFHNPARLGPVMLSRSNPTRNPPHRYRSDHLDIVQHSRRCACGSRNASRAQVDRAATVYRTWSRRRTERVLVAGPSNSGLETYWRWLSPQPTNPEADRRRRFPI